MPEAYQRLRHPCGHCLCSHCAGGVDDDALLHQPTHHPHQQCRVRRRGGALPSWGSAPSASRLPGLLASEAAAQKGGLGARQHACSPGRQTCALPAPVSDAAAWEPAWPQHPAMRRPPCRYTIEVSSSTGKLALLRSRAETVPTCVLPLPLPCLTWPRVLYGFRATPPAPCIPWMREAGAWLSRPFLRPGVHSG